MENIEEMVRRLEEAEAEAEAAAAEEADHLHAAWCRPPLVSQVATTLDAGCPDGDADPDDVLVLVEVKDDLKK